MLATPWVALTRPAAWLGWWATPGGCRRAFSFRIVGHRRTLEFVRPGRTRNG